jgi:hypothetical protein
LTDVQAGTGTNFLQQYVAVLVFVKANQHGFTTDQSRSAQVASWPEHCLDDISARFTAGLESRYFLALGDNDLARFRRNDTRVIGAQLARSRDGFFGLKPTGVQKLGRSLTAGSAFAKVIPVDLFAHNIPRRNLVFASCANRSMACPTAHDAAAFAEVP